MNDANVKLIDTEFSPVMSLVLPTTGNAQAVRRCVGSVTRQANEGFLRRSELIVFLNHRDDLNPETDAIRAYCTELKGVFGRVLFLISTRFGGTAEESALAAARHATGTYIWICGDRRIFLPEGIVKLEQFVLANAGDGAYFNSIWFDREGNSSGQYSTFFNAPEVEISYGEFVQRNGVNFIATGFGAWLVRRELLRLDVWQDIIDRGGAHFSHVFFYLDQIGNRPIKCFSVFLFVLETKIYHYGDTSEWERYARDHSTYRFFPWTFGLVRKYRVLYERGTLAPIDVRRSMCCERTILRRQIDEILRNFVNQLALAINFEDERISTAEFDELLSFCKEVAPESLIVCDLLVELFEQTQSRTSSKKQERRTLRMLARAINQDERNPLITSVVGQVGDYYVRLHPAGYLYSSIGDTSRFLWAYRSLGAPTCCTDWVIVAKLEDVPELPPQGKTPEFTLPLDQSRSGAVGRRRWRSAFARAVAILHNSFFGHILLSTLPRSWLAQMRTVVRRLR